jgi:plasmid stabilization system protein ParE
MNYRVCLSAEARRNLGASRRWIARRSPEGAARWVQAFDRAIDQLERDPFLSPLAPETGSANRELRNIFFQTRRGRRYRAVYYVDGDTVYITHIRGSGQQLIPPDDFE